MCSDHICHIHTYCKNWAMINATRHDPAQFKPSTLRFPSNLLLEEPVAFQVLVLGWLQNPMVYIFMSILSFPTVQTGHVSRFETSHDKPISVCGSLETGHVWPGFGEVVLHLSAQDLGPVPLEIEIIGAIGAIRFLSGSFQVPFCRCCCFCWNSSRGWLLVVAPSCEEQPLDMGHDVKLSFPMIFESWH